MILEKKVTVYISTSLEVYSVGRVDFILDDRQKSKLETNTF